MNIKKPVSIQKIYFVQFQPFDQDFVRIWHVFKNTHLNVEAISRTDIKVYFLRLLDRKEALHRSCLYRCFHYVLREKRGTSDLKYGRLVLICLAGCREPNESIFKYETEKVCEKRIVSKSHVNKNSQYQDELRKDKHRQIKKTHTLKSLHA